MESGPTRQGERSDKPESKPAKGQGNVETGKPSFTDEALFKDPAGVLEKLAGQARADQKEMDAGAKGGGREGRLLNGEAHRDPFDPAFRREVPDAAPIDKPGSFKA